MIEQKQFSPVDYGFTWTDDWYKFDEAAGRKAAMAARREYAKKMRAAGYSVRMFTIKNQRVSMGGIGSGRPHIDIFVSSVYMAEVS